MWTILCGVLIVLYILWVIRRKFRQIKAGNYCGCSCEECGQKCSFEKEKLNG